MKPYIIITLIILFSTSIFAQSNPFFEDVNGRPLYFKVNYVAEGSPYYAESYLFADAVTTNGKVYKNLLIKINLSEKLVQYKDDDEKEMEATGLIKSVSLMNYVKPDGIVANIKLQGFPIALNDKNSNAYEVLDSGKLSLLRLVDISFHDTKKYGEANVTRVFDRKEALYSVNETGVPKRCTKSKKEILALMKDKEKEVSLYADKNKLKYTNETDLKKIFTYYNSLFVVKK